MSEDLPGSQPNGTPGDNWKSRVSSVATDLTDRTRELIGMGNVRRLVVEHDGRTIVNLPLTIAAVAGLVVLVAAPWAVILVVLAGLYYRLHVRVEGGA